MHSPSNGIKHRPTDLSKHSVSYVGNQHRCKLVASYLTTCLAKLSYAESIRQSDLPVCTIGVFRGWVRLGWWVSLVLKVSCWWVGDFSLCRLGWVGLVGKLWTRLSVSVTPRRGWDGLYTFGDMSCLVVLTAKVNRVATQK